MPTIRYEHVYNRISYSPDFAYCLEVEQPAGIGGCLLPPLEIGAAKAPGRHWTKQELIRIQEAQDKRPLQQQVLGFDRRHSTIRLFGRDKKGAYVRLWQQQVQPADDVRLSPRGDVMVLPVANDLDLPKADIDLFDASGHRIARAHLDQFLTESDLRKAGYGPHVSRQGWPLEWSLRVDERTRHRIIVLSFDLAPARFSGHIPKIETVEYDADTHAIVGPQRNHF